MKTVSIQKTIFAVAATALLTFANNASAADFINIEDSPNPILTCRKYVHDYGVRALRFMAEHHIPNQTKNSRTKKTDGIDNSLLALNALCEEYPRGLAYLIQDEVLPVYNRADKVFADEKSLRRTAAKGMTPAQK